MLNDLLIIIMFSLLKIINKGVYFDNNAINLFRKIKK